MLSGFEASAGTNTAWPVEARQWLNYWDGQSAADSGKRVKLLDVLDDLRQQAQCGLLDNRASVENAVSRLVSIHDPNSSLGLGRRDCQEAHDARKIVAAMIRDFKPEVNARPVARVLPAGLEPSDFG
ncbi:MAG TPA: hypothetical protein PLO23_09660 [Alphaproteobacteria bacterium]|nr:hypothetical protein [Alphaproteobacteria bacterium]